MLLFAEFGEIFDIYIMCKLLNIQSFGLSFRCINTLAACTICIPPKMFRVICLVVVVVVFLAKDIHGRSISIPFELPEHPPSVDENHEHSKNDALKRHKKSFLSTYVSEFE